MDRNRNPGKEFKELISIYVNMSPQMEKYEIISNLQHAIRVNSLYHQDIITAPTGIYEILRDFLVLNGFKCTAYPGHRGSNYGRANCLFTEEADTAHGIECLKDIRITNIRTSNHNDEKSNST